MERKTAKIREENCRKWWEYVQFHSWVHIV